MKCKTFINHHPKLSIVETRSNKTVIKTLSPPVILLPSSGNSCSTSKSVSTTSSIQPIDLDEPNVADRVKREPQTPGRRSSCSAFTSNSKTSSSSDVVTTTTGFCRDPDALIALEQLASISSARCMERLAPTLPIDLLAQNKDLLSGNRSIIYRGGLDSKRNRSQYESTNRCPLCSRVYRSQSFLNEHMRKEHSILI